MMMTLFYYAFILLIIIRINIIVNIFKSIITTFISTIVVVSAAAIVYVEVLSNFIVNKLFFVFSPLLESTFSRASL